MILMLVALAFVVAISALLLVLGGILSAMSPRFRSALIGDQHAELEQWFAETERRHRRG